MQRVGKVDSHNEVSVTSDGGIMKTIIKEGVGEPIPKGKRAIVHYVGKLVDGSVFDSSRSRNSPFVFTVGKREVILGWDKGVQTMRKGELCILKCAPDYAYGSSGIGPIPPNATLMFEVELLDWSDESASSSFAMFAAVSVLILLVGYLYSSGTFTTAI